MKGADTLGVYDIQDLGVSGYREGPFFRTQLSLRFPGGQTRFPKVFGPSARRCAALEYAPMETVLFSAMDFDLAEAHALASDTAREAGGEAMALLLNSFLHRAGVGGGVDVEALLHGLGTEFALIAAVAPEDRIPIQNSDPEGEPYPFPAPRFALLAATGEPTLYEALVRVLSKREGFSASDASTGTLKRTTFEANAGMAFPSSPALAYDGRFLIFASHGFFLDAVLETRRTGGGLAEEDEFRLLTKDMPEECNGVTYVAYYLGDEIRRVLEWKIAQGGRVDGSSRAQALLNLLWPALGGMASVRTNEPRGIGVTTQQSSAYAPDFLSGAAGQTAVMGIAGAAPLLILAALAAPELFDPRTWAKAVGAREVPSP